MKRWNWLRRTLSMMLALVMLLSMAACSGSRQNSSKPTQSSKTPSDREETAVISQEVWDTLVEEEVREYDNAEIKVYGQDWRGVEVYNASVVVIDDGTEKVIGTAYDFTEAFGDSFDAQVAEAAQEPEWLVELQNSEPDFVLRELKPTIYITDEDTAVVARWLICEYEGVPYEIVMNLDSTEIYDLTGGPDAYNGAELTCKGETTGGAKENGTYYAYNPEHGYFVLKDPDDYDKLLGQTEISIEDWEVYGSDSADYSGKGDAVVFQFMQAMELVFSWYRDTFGQKSVDNRGSYVAVAIVDSKEGTYKNAGRLLRLETNKDGKTLLAAPEILAHEFAHGMLRTMFSYVGNTDKRGDVHEALADTFAAVYLKDWLIGAGVNNVKDIANARIQDGKAMVDAPTHMDDYILVKVDIWQTIQTLGIINEKKSDSHSNAFILSHALYKIWENQFDQDWGRFGDTLYRSIFYLSKNTGFQEYRDMFLYAMEREGFSKAEVAAASAAFEAAGIKTAKQIVQLRRKNMVSNAVNLFTTPIGEIWKMGGDQMDLYTPVGVGEPWELILTKGDARITIFACSEAENILQDPYAYPTSLSLQDAGEEGYPVTERIKTGMTYEDVFSQHGVTDTVSALQRSSQENGMETLYYYYNDTVLAKLYFADGILCAADVSYDMGLVTLMEMTCSDLRAVPWEEIDWFYSFSESSADRLYNITDGSLSIGLYYYGEEEIPDAWPYTVAIRDLDNGNSGQMILPGLSMGMTYQSLEEKFPMEGFDYNQTLGCYESFLNYNTDAGTLLITLSFSDNKTLIGATIRQWYS